ncbi:MAG: hypothetical protein R3E64_04610 [Halioglobus sp.]
MQLPLPLPLRRGDVSDPLKRRIIGRQSPSCLWYYCATAPLAVAQSFWLGEMASIIVCNWSCALRIAFRRALAIAFCIAQLPCDFGKGQRLSRINPVIGGMMCAREVAFG